ncbi:MAG: hypothetical protein QXJ17_02960 [Nitrososphaeria archaeon]
MSIKELFEIRRLGHSIKYVKVVFKSSLSNIKLGSFELDNVIEGSTLSIPFWVANVLEKHGFVEVQEERFDEDFFRSVAKEKLLKDSVNLSQLPDDFYVHLVDYINKKASTPSDLLVGNDLIKIRNDALDLVSIRIRKLLHYSRAYSDSSEILPKLTLEERILLQMIQKNVREFSSSIFKEGV